MYPGDPGPHGRRVRGQGRVGRAGVTTLRVGDDVLCLAGGVVQPLRRSRRSAAVARRPAGLTAVQASSLPLTFLTVYHGLHHLAGIKPGRARARPCGRRRRRPVRHPDRACGWRRGLRHGRQPEKQDYVSSLGVKAVFSSRTADFDAGLMAATGGEGVDVVLNSLTGEFIPASLRVLRKGGTLPRDWQGRDLDRRPGGCGESRRPLQALRSWRRHSDRSGSHRGDVQGCARRPRHGRARDRCRCACST